MEFKSLNCLVSASPPAAPENKILENMLAQLFVGFLSVHAGTKWDYFCLWLVYAVLVVIKHAFFPPTIDTPLLSYL